MFRLLNVRRHSSVLAGFALAATVLLIPAAPALAQQASARPQIPADAKGYQSSMIRQQQMQWDYAQQQARNAQVRSKVSLAPAAAAPTSLQVTITLPAQAPREYANIRGLDGQLHTFPLEGGRSVIVVRPGETATIRHVANTPAK